MRGLSKKIGIRHFGVYAAALALVLGSFLYFNHVREVRAETAIASPLVLGDVSGFAWMGTGISNQNVSQGGGGWLNFNCKAAYCMDRNSNGTLETSEKWGVTLDLNHSGTDGLFQGQAWSSNYGWLSFRPSDVSSCWNNNPGITDSTVARAEIENGGPMVDVVGWAKFIAGDVSTDGWDGCVAFQGANHGVELNLGTGSLSGWAWGGPIVGWVSFANPECRDCNTTVFLSTAPSISFWADDYLVPAGGSSILRWQATDSTTGNSVSVCPRYVNTSSYGHWNSEAIMPQAANIQEISILEGNLPVGQHTINNINADTTYEINCQDEFGVDLPAQYVTIEIEVPGCTDPAFPNYNPNANIDNGTCGGVGLPTITLNVITGGVPDNTLPEGSNNPVDYQVSPRWVFTNRDQFAPTYCTQSFRDENNQIQNLNAWTGAQLSVPPNVGNNPFDPSGNSWVTTTNIAMYADDAPANPVSTFTFTITCQDLNGNPISASDTVIIVADPNPVSPSLALFVENPTLIIGSGNYSETLGWTSNDPSNLSSCDGDFVRISPTAQNPNLVGWETGNLPEPNVTDFTTHQNSFNTLAGNVTAPATYEFTLTCDDDLNPGETVSASQTVQFITEPVSTEPPFLELRIYLPDEQPVGPYEEQIPATGWDNSIELDPFTLRWSALNVNGCKARSEQFVGNNPVPVSNNADWQGQDVESDGAPVDAEKSFSILGSSIMNTIFYVYDCIPDDTATFGTAPLTPAQVCMSITGQPFPQCTVTGPGSVPSYQEI